MPVEGIVLRKTPLREHDQLVVLLTRQLGKTAAVAKGSLKRGSRQAPALDEGTLVRCELVAGRAQAHVLTGAHCLRSWPGAKASPLAWAVAQYFLEVADALIYDHEPDERLWTALAGVLTRLEDGRHPLAVLREGQSELLGALGYGTAGEPAEKLRALLPRQPVALSLIAHLGGEPVS